ncbi:MAG: hypothetical protein MI674_02340, partial [Cytophagales bacterium]|nr:hypothetical protein [Cytophagales bacterium]
KKRMLPTRKGSRKHKAVANDSNFAVLRKQADLGQVTEQNYEVMEAADDYQDIDSLIIGFT